MEKKGSRSVQASPKSASTDVKKIQGGQIEIFELIAYYVGTLLADLRVCQL